jgi:2'-5' RNA ligase
MLTFDAFAGIRRLARHCQDQLPDSVLDPVPLDALHLTLGRLGFTDELPASTALSIATRVSCRNLSRFELAVGPLAGSPSALRFSVGPWSPILRLHTQLTNATRDVLGDNCVMNTANFRPHLSIAYANTAIPVFPLLPLIERLRTLPIAQASVSTAYLVELHREHRTYRFGTLHELPLGP